MGREDGFYQRIEPVVLERGHPRRTPVQTLLAIRIAIAL